jgi:hypothetical protein
VKKMSRKIWETLKHTKILTKIEEEKTQDLDFEILKPFLRIQVGRV